MEHPEYSELVWTEMVASLSKPGNDILRELDPHLVNIWHMASGISGEAGEIIDAIKKCVVYRKPLDRENVIEELGDIEFYLQGLRDALNIGRAYTLSRNFDKLAKKRYKNGYTDEAAIERADKS